MNDRWRRLERLEHVEWPHLSRRERIRRTLKRMIRVADRSGGRVSWEALGEALRKI